MRIIIDLQGMQTAFSAHRGVGRYTQNLVLEMLKQNDRHDIFLAMNGAMTDNIDYIKSLYSPYLPANNFIAWHQTFSTAALGTTNPALVEIGEILREVFFASYDPDLIFSTNLQEGMNDSAVTSVNRLGLPIRYATTLHDVVPLFYEDEYLSDKYSRKWYLDKIHAAISSDIIFTVSNSAKHDIITKLEVSPDNIIVADLGYDTSMYRVYTQDKSTDDILVRYNLPRPYIMYFGGCDLHKNLARLLKAYAQLEPQLRTSFDLALAGSDIVENMELRALATTLGIASNIRFCGYIAEADLPVVLSQSDCFVFPSTHEGFGLPALEAMACGAPVIGSRSSSIQEVIGNPVALFDPLDEYEMAARISEVLTDRAKRDLIVNSGLERAKTYAWENTARIVLETIGNLSVKIPPQGWGLGNPAEYMVQAIAGKTSALTDAELISVSESIAASFPIQRKPRVYVDISSIIIADHRSGIQRVTRGITSELLKLNGPASDVTYEVVYTSDESVNFFTAHDYVLNTLGFPITSKDSFVEFNAGDTLIYLDLHPSVAISHRSFNISLRGRGVKVYHVVYDILPILKPETFWPELCTEFRAWAETVSMSDGALCISNAVANEFKDFVEDFGEVRAVPLNIGWFHLGADIENSAPSKGYPADAEKILAQLVAMPSFLMVGTVEPRKGHKQTLAAFERLWADGHAVALVIVGRLGWGLHDLEKTLLTHPELGKRLFWLPAVSDEYLADIYNACTCLVAASEGEGFGLPLIEAAQRLLPIICRDLPVFREVAGEHAYYFSDKAEPAVIKEAIIDWLRLKNAEMAPSSRDMPWLSWAESAQQLVNLLRNDDWALHAKGGGAIIPDAPLTHRTNRIKFSGFAGVEADYRWTCNKEASLTFKWKSPARNSLLKIGLETLFHQDQAVEVLLEGRKMYSGTLRGGNTQLVCTLSGLKQGMNTVSLKLPDARRPPQAPDNDLRNLALAVKNIELRSEIVPLLPGTAEDVRSQKLLFQGWFGAEHSHRWSNGNRSRIDFNVEEDLQTTLTIIGRNFKKQKIRIYFDDKLIFSENIDTDDLSITSECLNICRGFHYLDFHFPNTRKSNTNPRLMSIAFISLTLNTPGQEHLLRNLINDDRVNTDDLEVAKIGGA